MTGDSALLKACRRRGIRLGPERLAVVQALAGSADHPTVEQLHARARAIFPRLSLPTVYRMLKELLRESLVFRFDFGDGRTRWEDATAGPHDHLIDADTGTITNLSDPRLEKAIAEVLAERGLKFCEHRLEIVYASSGDVQRHANGKAGSKRRRLVVPLRRSELDQSL